MFAGLPGLAYITISALIIATIVCKVGTKYSFNVNEGWNAYWASVAWSGGDLYPPVSSFKLNNYPPLWFYLTGSIGAFFSDNILAGRAIAGGALLLNGLVISLIAREIMGHRKGWWFAGAAFLAIFGLFYPDYVAANDPQIPASLLMTIAVFLVVRRVGQPASLPFYGSLVLLMIVAGLIKHNIIAAPLSIAIYLILSRNLRALSIFGGLSVIAVTVTCALLYFIYGASLFAAVLVPRPYSGSVAWVQTRDQLELYGLLLAVVPYLAFRTGSKERIIFIYAVVALLQGAVLSGGYDVDVNVFFDFAFCISIGLALMRISLVQFIERQRPWKIASVVMVCWLSIALLSPLLALWSRFEEIGGVFRAATDVSYQADLSYIRSNGPRVICEDPALCYWAGQPFNVDLNTLRIVISAFPDVEAQFVRQIENCSYSLIQLKADWTDEVDGPMTNKIRETLIAHYKQERETDIGLYWKPACTESLIRN